MMLVFLIALLSSAVGAICGIGGGVVIKPVMDMFRIDSVAAISFLSGCTVLSMSCYTVGRAMLAGEGRVDVKTGTPLALGAALGGLAGKALFTAVKDLFQQSDMVGAVQSACLAAITLGTLAYTLCKARIHTHRLTAPAACCAVGLALGICSSFLGIGGGPINLVVLYYFFSMDTRTAAANSLYIILFSQLASLLATLIAGTIPDLQLMMLVWMIAGGIGGGIIGRACSRRMDDRAVEKLFMGLMGVIIAISLFNCFRFAG
ncbi:MAG: sulfite exporter TauE/SafE family protein [Oscillospiraceae bacterium]|nr:sulfite exporter TauE/SafE family protein [Oscillospiraceae bacterium]